MIQISLSEMKTWATGNGVPCRGDLIEAEVDGVQYRAEFYVEPNDGAPYIALAGESVIEKFVDGSWEKVEFPDDSAGDAEFNRIVARITPQIAD